MAGGISIQASDGKYINLGFETGASGNVSATLPKEGGKLATQSGVDTAMSTINASVPAAYHIYNGQLALANTVITTGFSTTLYTGNGTTQSITTGVDMDTQWGNDASEKFGGLTWCKSISEVTHHMLYDTIRGATNNIQTNLTNAQSTNAQSLTAFGSNGFTIGSNVTLNTNLASQVAWNFQTTHRVSGTTNHGKSFICHYNPFTGFTIIKYEGSGLAGHEIPHYLGRKLGFSNVKNISATADWVSLLLTGTVGDYVTLNLTNAKANTTASWSNNSDTSVTLGTGSGVNTSANQYIMYGWANSYFDEKNNLIGNYEIGVYQGTGVTGNKVTTRGKPAWVMIKALSSTGNWIIFDNQRASGTSVLYPNLSNVEGTSVALSLGVDNFTISRTDSDFNASGGQYLYMVVYDNDSGSGKSKYPRATDTSTLNLNAHVPFANGIDTTGNKVSIAYKNETIALSNALTQGKNYIALLNDGSYVATATKPSYGLINPSSGDFFNLDTQKWYNNSNVAITPRNYLDCIVYADQNGQPEYVEQLPKTTYFGKVSIQNGFDLNQKWVDVTSNRVSGTTYTNTTGKPIQVYVNGTGAGSPIVVVNGVQIASATTNYYVPPTFIVPNGATYSVTVAISKWSELR